MKKYVLVFIAGVLLVPSAIYLYLHSGYAPVSTSASPMPFERFFAKLAMRATLSHDVPTAEKVPPTETDLRAGANIYRENCAVCHGLPNTSQTGISKGMYPHPPQFFRAGQITSNDPTRPFRPLDPKAYWKVKNGVRLTGMPGFKGSLTEQQIREVSQFVGNARNLPPGVMAVLDGQSRQEGSGDAASIPKPQTASRHK